MPQGTARLILFAAAAAEAAAGEWRLGAYLGAAASQSSYVRIEQPGLATRLLFSPVAWEGRSFEPAVYYGYRLGYFFGGNFGVEAEFIHQKVYALVDRTLQVEGILRGVPVSRQMPMKQIAGQFSISHGVNLLVANFVAESRLARRILLSGRFGAGPTIPHAESAILGEFRQGYQAGSPAIHAAAGFEFRLWRGLHWLTEYKFTRTRQHVDIAHGTGEALLRSHHGVFGLSWHF